MLQCWDNSKDQICRARPMWLDSCANRTWCQPANSKSKRLFNLWGCNGTMYTHESYLPSPHHFAVKSRALGYIASQDCEGIDMHTNSKASVRKQLVDCPSVLLDGLDAYTGRISTFRCASLNMSDDDSKMAYEANVSYKLAFLLFRSADTSICIAKQEPHYQFTRL